MSSCGFGAASFARTASNIWSKLASSERGNDSTIAFSRADLVSFQFVTIWNLQVSIVQRQWSNVSVHQWSRSVQKDKLNQRNWARCDLQTNAIIWVPFRFEWDHFVIIRSKKEFPIDALTRIQCHISISDASAILVIDANRPNLQCPCQTIQHKETLLIARECVPNDLTSFTKTPEKTILSPVSTKTCYAYWLEQNNIKIMLFFVLTLKRNKCLMIDVSFSWTPTCRRFCNLKALTHAHAAADLPKLAGVIDGHGFVVPIIRPYDWGNLCRLP